MKKIDVAQTIAMVHGLMDQKGFWPVPKTSRNAGEALMLAIGELGEGQEAHRTGIFCKDSDLISAFKNDLVEYGYDLENIVFETDNEKANYKNIFSLHIKDTLEDEIADTYYRLADFIGGFELDLSFVVQHRDNAIATYKEGFKQGVIPEEFNVGATFLTICHVISSAGAAYVRKDQQRMTELLGFSLGQLEVFAERWGMDLEWHIKHKHLCNAGRGYKYGKRY